MKKNTNCPVKELKELLKMDEKTKVRSFRRRIRKLLEAKKFLSNEIRPRTEEDILESFNCGYITEMLDTQLYYSSFQIKYYPESVLEDGDVEHFKIQIINKLEMSKTEWNDLLLLKELTDRFNKY